MITSLGFLKPALSLMQVSFRKLKHINIADFHADVASLTLPLVSTDLDDLVNTEILQLCYENSRSKCSREVKDDCGQTQSSLVHQ